MNDYTLVSSVRGLDPLIKSLLCADAVALDTETTGLDPRRNHLRLLQLATSDGCWLIDRYAMNLSRVWPHLVGKTIVMHNAQFDLQFLAAFGWEPTRVVCTQLASQVLYAGRWVAGEISKQTSLKGCASRELGVELDKELQVSDWGGELTPEMLAYAARDAAVLLPLWTALEQSLTQEGLRDVAELEFRTVRAVAWASFSGVGFDAQRWTTLCEEARLEAETLVPQLEAHVPDSYRRGQFVPINWNSRKESLEALRAAGVHHIPNANDKSLTGFPLGRRVLAWRRARKDGREGDMAEFAKVLNALLPVSYLALREPAINWHSTQQKAAILAELGARLPRTPKGSPRVDDDTLAGISHPLAALLRKYSDACKRAERIGWLDYADNGRIYPSWHQLGTETGRMSASKPPMQQVNRTAGHRSCFVAPPGRVLVKADYSQIELRVAAVISGDEAMLEAYEDGGDLHVRTAISIAGETAIRSTELLCVWAGVPPNWTGAEVLRCLWTGESAKTEQARCLRVACKEGYYRETGSGSWGKSTGAKQPSVEEWCRTAETAGVPVELVREVRQYQISRSAPSGSQQTEQRPIELRDALSILPFVGTRTLEELTPGGTMGDGQKNWKSLRQLAKSLGFGLIYGMGARKLGLYARVNYGVEMSGDEAAYYHRVFFNTYRGLRRWQRRAGDDGSYAAFTRSGRRRVLVRRTEDESFFTRRLNTPVQGTAGDGLKAAAALLYERRSECPDAVLVLFVHDELVLECDENTREATEAWLREAMVDGMRPLIDPVEVVVDTSWGYDWAGRKER